jgi:hypothetical protein
MDQIVLLKIESLHARVVQEAGLKLRQKRREFFTGSIAAHLDEKADPPANLGLINLTTGAIHLRWAIIAMLPVTADAFAAGQVSQKESGPLRVSFDEFGQVLKDGSGFDATGGGNIAPGSLLGSATIEAHSNFVRTIPDERKMVPMTRALANGNSVRCALIPESYLDLTLPSSLGGGTQRLNLVGAFVLVPVMSLGRREGTKRTGR